MRRTGDTIKISGDYQFQAHLSNNLIQRFWHNGKLQMINQLLPPGSNDKCLDIGCGSGVITDYLAQNSLYALGVDGNNEAISFARATFCHKNIEFINQLIDIHFDIQDFDKIYCFELIEHITEAQTEQLLKNIYRILKPGGKVLLTTPNYHSYWPLLEYLMDFFKLAPQLNGSQHVTHFSSKQLKTVIKRTNFEIKYLGSKYLFSPWFSLISSKLAKILLKKEITITNNFGPILICLLQK